MQENRSQITKKYFAAANSYSGFVSFFDNIFDPKEFTKIFILKGGPGTGKNSFMKKIAEHFFNRGFDVEEIYCSSDPNSLDGTIISCKDKKVAIVDGTSPHTRDPKFPGAVDEIINLGANWDDLWLIGNREKIQDLSLEKSKAYSTAYTYLKIAKEAFNFIKSTKISTFNIKNAKRRSEIIIKSTISTSSKKHNIRLISAFSKNGFVSFNTIEKISDSVIKIGGDRVNAMLFLNSILNEALTLDYTIQSSPYPLSTELSEALFLPDTNIGVILSDSTDFDINSDDFSKKIGELELERIKKAEQIEEDARTEAQRWLGIACDLHFRLENIYSKAMRFEKNDDLLSTAIEDIEIIFDKIK